MPKRRTNTIDGIVNDILKATVNLPPVLELTSRTPIPNPVNPIQADTWNCNRDSSIYIYHSHIGKLPMAIRKGDNFTIPNTEAQGLSNLIYCLAIYVFELQIHSSEGRLSDINIFYEKSDTLAFNLQSRLFFNCYYFDPNQSSNSNIGMWFSIFCHEFAHNASRNHDMIHSYTMTVLHTKFISNLKKLLK